MRIWDIDPGFLNDQSLLGEHRELHGIYSVVCNNKKGYAAHPETRRWKEHLTALGVRHELLVAEMKLRGFQHHSPLDSIMTDVCWPSLFIDQPGRQYAILAEKYRSKKQGRIPLPQKIGTLWAAHKYSVMARSPATYKALGPKVAHRQISFNELAAILVGQLRKPPEQGRLYNALSHMWGYISPYSDLDAEKTSVSTLLAEIQSKTFLHGIQYLRQSTAIGELAFWSSIVEKTS